MSDNVFAVSNLVSKQMTEFFVVGSALYNTSNKRYVGDFNQQNFATGGTLNVKVPAYPAVQTGLSVTAEGIEDLVIPYNITTNDIYSVARLLDLYEYKFDILGGSGAFTKNVKQAIVDNYAYPAYQAIQAKLERTAANKLSYTGYLTPVDGIEKLGSINTFSSISQVSQMMNWLKLQPEERYLVMNPTDANKVSDSLQNMFNESINKNITANARIGGPEKGRLAGLDMYYSSDMPTHVAGALAGVSGITVSSIDSTGTIITLAGVPSVSSVLVKAGDMISIPSVRLAQPATKQTIPYRLVVVAAQDANGDGAGNVAVTISYPLMVTGEHANVTALPANGAPVDVYPDYNMNYAYTPSGLSFVPLELGDIYGATNSNAKGDNRCPVKVQLQGSVTAFTNTFRISVLVGIRAFAPYVIPLPSKAN